MDSLELGYNEKSKVNNYVTRAVSRIIVPKGTNEINISIGEDSLKVDNFSKEKKSAENADQNQREPQ